MEQSKKKLVSRAVSCEEFSISVPEELLAERAGEGVDVLLFSSKLDRHERHLVHKACEGQHKLGLGHASGESRTGRAVVVWKKDTATRDEAFRCLADWEGSDSDDSDNSVERVVETVGVSRKEIPAVALDKAPAVVEDTDLSAGFSSKAVVAKELASLSQQREKRLASEENADGEKQEWGKLVGDWQLHMPEMEGYGSAWNSPELRLSLFIKKHAGRKRKAPEEGIFGNFTTAVVKGGLKFESADDSGIGGSFNWRGEDAGTGEVEYDPYGDQTGFLELSPDDILWGEFVTPFGTFAFKGKRVSAVPTDTSLSYYDYTEEEYERRRVDRWK